MFFQVGRQAVHHAAAVGNIAVVKLLIEHFKVPATVADKVHITTLELLYHAVEIMCMLNMHTAIDSLFVIQLLPTVIYTSYKFQTRINRIHYSHIMCSKLKVFISAS